VRPVLAFAAAAALWLAAPPAGRAAVETLTFRSAPITIQPYFTAQGSQAVASPRVDGYVVGFSASVVDTDGRELGNAEVMLHHVVFANVLRRDAMCSSFAGFEGQTLPYAPERFFAAGEEHYELSLPGGYGYANGGKDVWGLVYMLMNHKPVQRTVQVQYTVRYVTGESLTPVRPLWLDIRNCRADPVWDVPGTGGKGSTFVQRKDFRVPLSGRLVAGGAHMHGGAVGLEVANTTCGASLFRARPTWGFTQPRPWLHETGPSHMTSFQTPTGIPVAAGDVLRLSATYDNSLPHTRVMGISIVFLAPGAVSGCGATPPLQLDEQRPGAAPLVRFPLPAAPRGPVRTVTSSLAGDFRFSASRVEIRRGTRFTWRFVGPTAHNVTVANGPIGFSSPSTLRGSFSYRFTRPGTYGLICALHPVAMTQVVRVR
jgi:plastocyanin